MSCLLCINIKLSENHYKPLGCWAVKGISEKSKIFEIYIILYLEQTVEQIIIHITFFVLHLFILFGDYIYYFSYFDQTIFYLLVTHTNAYRRCNTRQYFLIVMNDFCLPSSLPCLNHIQWKHQII